MRTQTIVHKSLWFIVELWNQQMFINISIVFVSFASHWVHDCTSNMRIQYGEWEDRTHKRPNIPLKKNMAKQRSLIIIERSNWRNGLQRIHIGVQSSVCFVTNSNYIHWFNEMLPRLSSFNSLCVESMVSVVHDKWNGSLSLSFH